MTDEKRCPDPALVIRHLPAGTGVIFRNYRDPNRKRLGRECRALCRERDLLFLVAGDPDLARALGAGGIHIPEWALARADIGGDLNPGWIVTAAVHSPEAIAAAEKIGASALLIAPLFATASHPQRAVLGTEGFARLAGLTHLPVYALGGITESNAKTIPRVKNLAGVAGISMFMPRGG